MYGQHTLRMGTQLVLLHASAKYLPTVAVAEYACMTDWVVYDYREGEKVEGMWRGSGEWGEGRGNGERDGGMGRGTGEWGEAVSYTHLRAHET